MSVRIIRNYRTVQTYKGISCVSKALKQVCKPSGASKTSQPKNTSSRKSKLRAYSQQESPLVCFFGPDQNTMYLVINKARANSRTRNFNFLGISGFIYGHTQGEICLPSCKGSAINFFGPGTFISAVKRRQCNPFSMTWL